MSTIDCDLRSLDARTSDHWLLEGRQRRSNARGAKARMNDGGKQKPRVILADDNAQILKLTAMLLRIEFDVVAAVSNGEEAIEAVNRLRPDVLVLDVQMPVLDGVQTAKRLKEWGSPTKIVILSGLEDPAHVEYAREVTASAFVSKAYISSDLPRAICEAVAGRFFTSSRLRV